MDGIVTILDADHSSRVESLWHSLQDSCGLKGVLDLPIPHFSWHLAEVYDEELLHPVLADFCSSLKAFTVRTAGIGLFTGEQMVIYLSLVKDEQLINLHERLWQRLDGFGYGISPYYSPGLWVPHITLAWGDVSLKNVGCAVQHLASRSYDWMLPVDNLALVGQSDDVPRRECFRCTFGEKVE